MKRLYNRLISGALRGGMIVAGGLALAGKLHAQQPVTWNYSFETSGQALATYPGDVTVLGKLNLAPTTVFDPLNAGQVYSGGVTSATRVTNWVNVLRPASTSISQAAFVSSAGFQGAIGASRTSDNTCSACQGSIGIESIENNDNVTQVQFGYAGYFEATRQSGAGTTQALEIDIHNLGSVIDINPYSMITTGETPGLWVASGAGFAGSNDNSAAIGILANGAKWKKGIVFSATGLTLRADNKYEAISLPTQDAISFYNSTGSAIVGNIYSLGTSTAYLGQVFTGGQIYFENTAGTPLVTFNGVGGEEAAAIGGHIGTAPTFSIGAGAGSGATVACKSTYTCDNISGRVTVTAGTSPAVGIIYTINFNVARIDIPNCVININSPNTAFVSLASTAGAQVSTSGAVAASTAVDSTYVCMGS